MHNPIGGGQWPAWQAGSGHRKYKRKLSTSPYAPARGREGSSDRALASTTRRGVCCTDDLQRKGRDASLSSDMEPDSKSQALSRSRGEKGARVPMTKSCEEENLTRLVHKKERARTVQQRLQLSQKGQPQALTGESTSGERRHAAKPRDEGSSHSAARLESLNPQMDERDKHLKRLENALRVAEKREAERVDIASRMHSRALQELEERIANDAADRVGRAERERSDATAASAAATEAKRRAEERAAAADVRAKNAQYKAEAAESRAMRAEERMRRAESEAADAHAGVVKLQRRARTGDEARRSARDERSRADLLGNQAADARAELEAMLVEVGSLHALLAKTDVGRLSTQQSRAGPSGQGNMAGTAPPDGPRYCALRGAVAVSRLRAMVEDLLNSRATAAAAASESTSKEASASAKYAAARAELSAASDAARRHAAATEAARDELVALRRQLAESSEAGEEALASERHARLAAETAMMRASENIAAAKQDVNDSDERASDAEERAREAERKLHAYEARLFETERVLERMSGDAQSAAASAAAATCKALLERISGVEADANRALEAASVAQEGILESDDELRRLRVSLHEAEQNVLRAREAERKSAEDTKMARADLAAFKAADTCAGSDAVSAAKAAEVRLLAMEGALAEFRTALAEAEARAAEAEATTAEAEARAAAAVATAEEAREAHESDIFAANEAALEAERSLRVRAEGNEQQLETARAEVAALQSTAEAARSELRAALEHISALEDRLATLNSVRAEDRARALQTADELAMRADEEAARAAQAEAARDEARIGLDRAAERAAQARSAALREARRERDSVVARENAQRHRAEEAEIEVKELRERLSKAHNERKAHRAEIAAKVSEFDVMRQRYLNAEREREVAETGLATSVETLATMRGSLARLKRKLSALEAEATEAKAKHADINRALQNASEARRAECAASQVARAATAEALRWREALIYALAALDDANIAMHELATDHASEGIKAGDAIRAALNMAAGARREVSAALRETSSRVQQALCDAQERASALTLSVSRLNKQIVAATKRADREHARAESHDLRASEQITLAESRHEAALARLAELEGAVGTYQARVRETGAFAQISARETATLRAQMAQLREAATLAGSASAAAVAEACSQMSSRLNIVESRVGGLSSKLALAKQLLASDWTTSVREIRGMRRRVERLHMKYFAGVQLNPKASARALLDAEAEVKRRRCGDLSSVGSARGGRHMEVRAFNQHLAEVELVLAAAAVERARAANRLEELRRELESARCELDERDAAKEDRRRRRLKAEGRALAQTRHRSNSEEATIVVAVINAARELFEAPDAELVVGTRASLFTWHR